MIIHSLEPEAQKNTRGKMLSSILLLAVIVVNASALTTLGGDWKSRPSAQRSASFSKMVSVSY